MADRKTIDNRNQLYPKFDLATPLDKETRPHADAEQEEEGKPRFGQRGKPDDAFFERLIKHQAANRQPLLHPDVEKKMEASSRQAMAAAIQKQEASLEGLAAVVADHSHERPAFSTLRLPEDLLGPLPQVPANLLSACVEALKKSQ